MHISLEKTSPEPLHWDIRLPETFYPAPSFCIRSLTLTEVCGIYPGFYKDRIQPLCSKNQGNIRAAFCLFTLTRVFSPLITDPCPQLSLSSLCILALRKANLSWDTNEWTRLIICGYVGQEKGQCTYERGNSVVRKGFWEHSSGLSFVSSVHCLVIGCFCQDFLGREKPLSVSEQQWI